MKKTKKRILGCLAAVVILIAAVVAYKIIDENVDAVTSVTDTIVVKVFDQYPTAIITYPENEAALVGTAHTITYDWANATDVEFVLTYNGATITTWIDEYGEFPPGTHPSGSNSHEIFLNEYGKYILTATANGPIGTSPGGSSEDSIIIYRLATSVSYLGSEANGDPKVNIRYDEGVKNLRIQVYDINGNPILSSPITMPITEGADNLDTIIRMPDNYPAGEYRIEVEGLDASGARISDPSFTKFNYAPPAPDVPDTGGFLKDLNIAQSDLLITGLLVFFSVTALALFLIYRKKEQN